MKSNITERVEEAARAYDNGIRAVLLFGLPERKDAIGSASWDPSGPVQSAIEGIKRSIPQMTVIAEYRLCIDPLAKVGKEVGSQSKETNSRHGHKQHSQSEPIQVGFSPEDKYKIHKRLDEK